MTRRYLVRIGIVILILVVALGAILWLRPQKVTEDKWRFFRLGQANPAASAMTGQLVFLRIGGATPDLDNLALLPGGLAYLPKNAVPLFGQRAARIDAIADIVLQPEKCLLVRSIQFAQPPAADGSAGRVLLNLDEKSRSTAPSTKLRAMLPQQCAASDAQECQIVIWAEARPKKCD